MTLDSRTSRRRRAHVSFALLLAGGVLLYSQYLVLVPYRLGSTVPFSTSMVTTQGCQQLKKWWNNSIDKSSNCGWIYEIDCIGRYTATAIASIAFNVTVPVVDGNVCRVLPRLRDIANHITARILKDDLGWKLEEQIVRAADGSQAGEVNQVLMELDAHNL